MEVPLPSVFEVVILTLSLSKGKDPCISSPFILKTLV